MVKKLGLGIIWVIFSLIWVISTFAQEQFTITTYYPSPYGSYRELRAQRMAIGDNYYGPDYCWPPDSCANQFSANADLLIEDNVGIGDPTPDAKLDILNTGTGASFRVDDSSDDDTTPFIIDADGQVGIGTASPGAKLDVIGNIAATGAIRTNDNLEIQKPGFGSGWLSISSGVGGSGNLDLTAASGKVVSVVTTASPADVAFGVWKPGIAGLFGIFGNGNTYVRGKLNVYGDLEVSGSKTGFMIAHPTKPGMELVHTVLEGPEVAVFYRGQTQLVNGQAVVKLPDYFESLTRKENRTALITPKFEADEPISVLAASEVKEGSFLVKAIDVKNPSQKFYWEVKAVRADVEPLEVERPKGDKK